MTDALAHYHFLPWLRAGLATAIKSAPTGMRTELSVGLHVKADPVFTGTEGDIPAKTVALYGPGDVLGFDPRIVTRTDPRPNVGDAEPNYIPAVEFADSDFPWRFTAFAPDALGHLTPWIKLIVLKDDEIEGHGRMEDTQVPWIEVATTNLPDLSEAWRWAHVQVTTNGTLDRAGLVETIKTTPERDVSRLICPRRLTPGTLYRAFVVPTFKLGRYAGIGMDPAGINAQELAWDTAEGPGPVKIPHYYTWEFRTGLRGDFEYLVRLLEPRKLSALGIREMNCEAPGYDIGSVERTDEDSPYPHSLGLEGALMSLDTQFSPWGKVAGETTTFQQRLADEVLNKPRADLTNAPGARPKVVPPIYGRWHAARREVYADGNAWIDTLNLDPRHRTAAGLGTKVVQEHQEQLMASAWDQVGALEDANELLRRAQLGREGSRRIFGRLTSLATGDFLQIAGPVNARVRMTGNNGGAGFSTTIHQVFSNSRIPLAALDPAFRRMRRPRGIVAKRQQVDSHPGREDVLERLNSGEIAAAGPPPNPDGMYGLCEISFDMLRRVGLWKWVEAACGKEAVAATDQELGRRLKLFCEANINCDTIMKALAQGAKSAKKKNTKEYSDLSSRAKVICEVFQAWLDAIPGDDSPPDPIDLGQVRHTLLRALDPRETIIKRTKHRLRFLDMPEPADPCAERKVTRELFPQPKYKPLSEMSQDLILPGIETVPQNTIALLKTNGRFVESYMCGWNHAFAGEALWRELPVPLSATFARQFWDVSGYVPSVQEFTALRDEVEASLGDDEVLSDDEIAERAETLLIERLKDIKPIRQWGSTGLGENDNRAENAMGENLVLIIRGDLLKKYPNTVIYAVKAQHQDCNAGPRVPGLPEFLDCAHDIEEEIISANPPKYPLFSGTLPPDITFLGFDLTETAVRGDDGSLGWYFVIEERVSEARFGMDVPTDEDPPTPATWDDLTWGHVQGLQEDEYLNNLAPTQPTDNAGKNWDDSSASVAWITLQKPVRIAVHATTMIPEGASD